MQNLTVCETLISCSLFQSDMSLQNAAAKQANTNKTDKNKKV